MARQPQVGDVIITKSKDGYVAGTICQMRGDGRVKAWKTPDGALSAPRFTEGAYMPVVIPGNQVDAAAAMEGMRGKAFSRCTEARFALRQYRLTGGQKQMEA
jgi:hypothetical protein